MTRRLAETVIQPCERLPTLHGAQMFGLHWDTVRLLERRALQVALSALPKAQPRRLVMDQSRYSKEIVMPVLSWMRLHGEFYGLAKAAAAPRSGLSSKSWGRKVVPKSKPW